MRVIITNLALLFGVLLVGCQHQATFPESLKAVVSNIEAVDVNPDHYQSYSDYHSRVDQQMQDIVRKISSSTELKQLFIECTQKSNSAPEQPQERLQWVDAYLQARHAVLFRMAELNTDETAKILVELYADSTFDWDGEFSLCCANAISKCGARALPHLKRANFGDRKSTAQRIIVCIEKGELYGP